MRESFATTRWTRVLRAGREPNEAGREALEELCSVYWPALHAYLRARGRTDADASDLVQGFFERLFARDGLARVAPEGGRFRDWLLAGLRNHARDERERGGAEKRGGGRSPIPLERPNAELAEALAVRGGADPAQTFEVRWAALVLDRARERVLATWSAPEAERQALAPVLSGEEPDRAALRRYGLSPVAIRVRAHRLRGRLRDAILEEVRTTLGPKQDLEAEVGELLAALAAAAEEPDSA